jgi:hypothetical protein
LQNCQNNFRFTTLAKHLNQTVVLVLKFKENMDQSHFHLPVLGSGVYEGVHSRNSNLDISLKVCGAKVGSKSVFSRRISNGV